MESNRKKWLCSANDKQPLYGFNAISVDEIVKKLEKEDMLYCDTETTGLSPIDDDVITLQISTNYEDIVIDATSVDIKVFAEVLSRDSYTFVAQNAKFDYKMLNKYGIVPKKVYCTMVVESVLNAGMLQRHKAGNSFISCSLSAICKRRLSIEMDKDVRNSFIGFSGDHFTEDQLEYGLLDSQVLIDIRKLQLKDVNSLKLGNVVALEMESLLVFASMELRGVGVDKEKWLEYAKDFEEESNHIEDRLNKYIIGLNNPEFVKIDLFEGVVPNINWNSSAQLVRLLRTEHPDLESAKKDVLDGLDGTLVNMIKEFNSHKKNIGTYGRSFLDHKVQHKKRLNMTLTDPSGIHSDGLFHCNYIPVVDSGRCGCNNPNFQNIPSSTKHRSLFRTPTKGWKWIANDFNSQELVIMASSSGEESWIEILKNGGDLHTENAKRIFRINEVSPERRQQSKALTFGLCYGKGAFAFAKDLDISEDEAQDIMDLYFEAFPKVKKWLDNNRNEGVSFGSVRTLPPFNRVRMFPGWSNKMTRKVRGTIGRASMNSPVQGTAADITKLALIFINRRILKEDLPMHLLIQVHDEVLLEVRPDFAEQGGRIVEEEMERAADAILVPGLLKSGSKISDTWEK